MDQLEQYLQRIGYRGSLEPSPANLRALHRAHIEAIPYENLDIHLGKTLSLDLDVIFEKMVHRRRGGWCYEQNSLLAWALGKLGYEVQFLSGAVGREQLGDLAEGNHLVLLVQLDQPYIADAGFGDGPLEPILLREGNYRQGFLNYSLSREGERWYFHNHPYGGASGFDFTLKPHAIADFAERCRYLQTSPDSGFVRTTVCQTLNTDRIATLRGAVFKTTTAKGTEQRVIEQAEDYRRVLQTVFGLEILEVEALFDKVWQRHQQWQGGDTGV